MNQEIDAGPGSENVIDLTGGLESQQEEIERLRLRKALLIERLAAANALAAEREQRIADLRLALFIVPAPRRDDPRPSRPSVDVRPSSPGEGGPPDAAPAPLPVRPEGQFRRAVLSGADQLGGGRAEEGGAATSDHPWDLPHGPTVPADRGGQDGPNPLSGRIPWRPDSEPARVPWWARRRNRDDGPAR